MTPDVETRLDGAKQVFVPVDFEVRMEAALHENARATQIDRFLDLVEDDFCREYVAFLMTEWAIESTETTVFGTEVRVIDVPVDDVTDDPVGMKPLADRIRFHPESY